MTKPIKMVVVLTLVGLFSGLSLVGIYKYTTPFIEANQAKGPQEAIFKIVPKAATHEVLRENGEEIFKIYDKRDRIIGYAFIAEGQGYQGNIKMIAAIKKNLRTMYGIEVLESVETPGLGGEIATDKFKEQFANKPIFPQIECDAITGATITSKSVDSILNEKIKRIVELLK